MPVIPVARGHVLAADADGAGPGCAFAATVGEDVVGGEGEAAGLAVLCGGGFVRDGFREVERTRGVSVKEGCFKREKVDFRRTLDSCAKRKELDEKWDCEPWSLSCQVEVR